MPAERGKVRPRAGAASEDPHRPGLRLLRGRLQALPPRVQSKMAAAFQVFLPRLEPKRKKVFSWGSAVSFFKAQPQLACYRDRIQLQTSLDPSPPIQAIARFEFLKRFEPFAFDLVPNSTPAQVSHILCWFASLTLKFFVVNIALPIFGSFCKKYECRG